MIDDTRVLSRSIAAGIISVGLLIAVVVAVHVIVRAPAIDGYPTWVFNFAFISNLVAIPLLTVLATKRSVFKLPSLIWVHISMAVMIVFFSQTYSPFTTAWSILILVSSVYYRWIGFICSGVVLALSAVAYIVLFPQNLSEYGGTLNYSILSVLVVAITMFMSYLFVRVIMQSHKKTRQLEKAQKSEQLQITRLNTLLNSIGDPVLTLSRYGHITSQNAAAQAFFDTNESLIGREVDNLIEVHDSENARVTVKGMIDEIKLTTSRDDLVIGKGRATRHLNFQMSRIRSTFGDIEDYGVVLIIRDITQQKTLEEEKDEFISVVSHELRTPAAIAEGSLSNFMVMQERHADESKLKEAADTAYKQVIFLSKMINDLSTLSRAERGVGSDIETINVNDMLRDLYNRYAPEASAKSLRLDLDLDADLPHVETSRLYLEEIIQNFITNAIKYTKEGSVTIQGKLIDGNRIRFAISDTGIGMTKTDLQHIFDKFYRSEDYRTRETSGTGLGLYVVGKLAAKLNTKIEVSTRLNYGSTFAITLPAAAPANPTQAPAGEPAKEPSQAVVEDKQPTVTSAESSTAPKKEEAEEKAPVAV